MEPISALASLLFCAIFGFLGLIVGQVMTAKQWMKSYEAMNDKWIKDYKQLGDMWSEAYSNHPAKQ